MRFCCPLPATEMPVTARDLNQHPPPDAARASMPGPGLARVAATLCGGAVAGALFGALLLIVAGVLPRNGGGEPAFVPSNLLFAYFMLLFTVPAALVIGLPSYYVLTHCRRLSAFWVGTVGVLGGAGVGTLLMRGVPSGPELLTFAGIGLVCALTSRALLLRSRPAQRIPPDKAMG